MIGAMKIPGSDVAAMISPAPLWSRPNVSRMLGITGASSELPMIEVNVTAKINPMVRRWCDVSRVDTPVTVSPATALPYEVRWRGSVLVRYGRVRDIS